MALYPTCVRCLGADSEVDALGVCTTCKSRGSNETPAGGGQRSPVRPIDPDPEPVIVDTKTVVPQSAATVTDPHDDGSTLATPVPPNAPRTPDRFADYDRLKYLDRGGMGRIYTARDTRTERIVALKLMSGVDLNDRRLRARFLTEGKALARLAHPGVVQVYEVDEWENTPYIAMEFVAGGSLAKRLRTSPRPTPVEAAGLMAEVASAVAAAHDKKILHRDIKPGNILLTETGRAKLADFGLASLIDETTRMTNPDGVLGTPAYMPPEQAAGKFGEVGPRSDVYSLGATLYDVLTGKPPFTGDHPAKVINSVINDDVVAPSKHVQGIPPDLDRVVCRCLEKRPQDRYESAAALANDLSRVARGEPIGKVSFIWHVRRFVRRNGKVMGAVGLLLLLVLLIATLKSGIVALPDDPEARMELARKEAEEKLKAGEPVEVVGPTGLPRYYHQYFGDGKLTQRIHPAGDRCAEFDSLSSTCYDLCADTMTDRYTVQAELQHLVSHGDETRVGLYLRGRGQVEVIRWTAAMYSDFFVARPPLNDAANDLKKLKLMNRAREFGLKIHERICVTRPAIITINGNENGPGFHFPPANRLANEDANPWRKIQIEVSPTGFVVYWEVDGQMTPVIRRSREILHDGDKELQILLNRHAPERTVPAWEPRAAVGVFAEKATVAFKNVWITPGLSP